MSSEQKRFGRRQFLSGFVPHVIVTATVFGFGTEALLILKDKTDKPAPHKEPGNLDTKKVTIEPDEEIGVTEFKEKTEELFKSLSRNPKSELVNYGQNGIGYKIKAPPSGGRVEQLTITKGQIATGSIGFHPPLEGAYMLEIDDGAGYYELVSFSETVPPSRFYPAPAIDAENGIYEPVKMAPNEMADFVRKAAYIANSA